MKIRVGFFIVNGFRTLIINLKLKIYPTRMLPFFPLIAASKIESYISPKARIKAGPGSYLRLGYDKNGTYASARTGINIELHEKATLVIKGVSQIGHGASVRIYSDGVLEIGNKTYIAGKATLACCKKITIGDNCAISWNVTIMDSDFHHWSTNGIEMDITKPIVINDNVWIGNNVIILKGVTIGYGAIVAAGSVVTKNVQPRTLVAGNPARIVRKNVEWI